MSLKWPEPMPENGRLSREETYEAWATGICRVIDPKMSCPQTLNVTLFFDGTNNNDDEKNPWRDSLTQTHTNVARLHNAALLEPHNGPVKDALDFLKRHASLEAARRLPPEVVALFDDYVHDSRCWFRVPYFHEYAPGGYFWPRIVFTANDARLSWLGFDPLSVALDTGDAKAAAFA